MCYWKEGWLRCLPASFLQSLTPAGWTCSAAAIHSALNFPQLPAALPASPTFLLAPEARAVGQLPQLMLWFPWSMWGVQVAQGLWGMGTSGGLSCLLRECVASLHFFIQAGGWCVRAFCPELAHVCLYLLLDRSIAFWRYCCYDGFPPDEWNPEGCVWQSADRVWV